MRMGVATWRYREQSVSRQESLQARESDATCYVLRLLKVAEEQEGCGDGSNGVFRRSAQPVCSITWDGGIISLSFL